MAGFVTNPRRALLMGAVSLTLAHHCCIDSAAAEEPTKAPAAQTQPAKQPAPASKEQKQQPQYSAEQQKQLDRASNLLAQVGQLIDEGKYSAAIPLATEALKLRETILPADDPLIASACSWLGNLNQRVGNYAEAKPLCERALKIYEQALGPDHPDVATAINNLAALNKAQGNYAAAVKLDQRAIKIREKALGPDHPLLATSLNNLGLLYKDQGNYAEALPLLQRALKIRQSVLGPDHPDVAQSLNNLGALNHAQGNYAEAVSLYQQSLKIREKVLGPDHPDVANTLTNLGVLYQIQGNFAGALPLYQRALKIDESALGSNHPKFAMDLHNLASLYQDQDNFAEALPLYQRSLKILETAFGPDHPQVASALNSTASLYQHHGNYTEALPLYERALKIREQSLGPNHTQVATALNNLASLYQDQAAYTKAMPLYERSLAIQEHALGPNHPNVALSLNNLAALYRAMGNWDQAEPLSHRALGIMKGHLERTSAVQSEPQQLSMAAAVRFYLSNYLTIARKDNVPAEEVYSEVLAWKGSVSARQQAMRQLRGSSQDPKVAELYQQLTDTARQLDSLSRATSKPEQAEQYRNQLAALNDKLETLQGQLAGASADYRRELAQEKLTPADLRHALPASCALVDLLEYNDFQPAKKKGQQDVWETHLAAFVIRAQHLSLPQPSREGKGSEIAWIDLGPTQAIADLVDHWRQSYSPADGSQLRKLVWQPLEEKLAGATTVLVSPDGPLDRFPIASLAGKKEGTYLIEDIAVATIPIPRLLPELLAGNSPSPRPSPTRGEGVTGAESTPAGRKQGEDPLPSLLTVGEVDFKAALQTKASDEQLAMRAPLNRDHGGWQFLPLEGTRAEIVAINDSFEQRFPDAPHKSLRKAQATKQAVCDSMPHYSYLHLATHGFFTPPEIKSALASSDKPGNLKPDTHATSLVVAGYHPDLLCGLALAGANQRAEPGQDDGILTALAVEELDLSHVQLATLSACETGLGRTAGGEGVLGLQRAFQLAGAKSTVATLWKIPDKASQILMTDFYANLWDADKHLSKLESLRQAQLKMLHEGANRGLELADDNIAHHSNQNRLPPYYWAAFQLSGDWR